jgi:hypothetical protein
MTGLAERMALSPEPNRRRQQIHARIVASTAPTVFPAAMTAGGFLFANAQMGTLLGMMSLVIGTVISLMTGINGGEDPVTRRPRQGTETDIGEMMDMLVRISRTGVRPVDRPMVQNTIDRGAASLTHVLGEEPWISMRRVNPDRWNLRPIPVGEGVHPSDLGTMLSTHGEIARFGTARNGVNMSFAQASISEVLPAMVAIAEAFDLDTAGLAIDKKPLPGMTTGRKQLTEAAARVHILADRWRKGSTHDVDPVLRLEADAAAGRDLRDLESVWAAARSEASPERIIEIDRTYRQATEALERTLETALGASGDRAVDMLKTHTRYITSKHAVGAHA